MKVSSAAMERDRLRTRAGVAQALTEAGIRRQLLTPRSVHPRWFAHWLLDHLIGA
jgi:hypothetical protein